MTDVLWVQLPLKSSTSLSIQAAMLVHTSMFLNLHLWLKEDSYYPDSWWMIYSKLPTQSSTILLQAALLMPTLLVLSSFGVFILHIHLVTAESKSLYSWLAGEHSGADEQIMEAEIFRGSTHDLSNLPCSRGCQRLTFGCMCL